jgi:hypothetical protein
MSAADTGDARSFDAGALEAAVLERLDRFEERHGRPAADNQ